ncbi:MAG: hypothetical protein DDT21_00339 [Syntrophomonadaceae bacterium]|nr:hypothetical protein [Bacillota bacterium]
MATLERLPEPEQVVGYICGNGHRFWLDFVWPAPPKRCPACSLPETTQTGYGLVTPGLKRKGD